jgi:muconolactone delta-isomerase
LKISAKDIERWAETREAQGELPRMIRRLAVQAGTVTEIAFPAGDSVSRPGLDGQILSNEGDPWVPAGRSAWEVSVERNVTPKANRDYKKRTQATDQATRQQSTLVAVTARHWARKGEWASHWRAQGDWKDVRAYDSDDLEAWLEASPAIALAFAEEIGRAGFGIETLGRHWQTRAAQCEPGIWHLGMAGETGKNSIWSCCARVSMPSATP